MKEMLLRLRWDHRDDHAHAKLSKIVSQIWDGLEGITHQAPLTSALWIADDADEASGKQSCPSVPDFIAVTGKSVDVTRSDESVTTTGADWSVV